MVAKSDGFVLTYPKTLSEAEYTKAEANFKSTLVLTDTPFKGAKMTQNGTIVVDSTQAAFEYTEYAKKMVN